MKAQVNRVVGPRVPQHSNNMASHLREFIWISPTMFFGSRLDEDPKDFLDEVYKILYAIGVPSIKKAEFESY